MSKNRFKSGAFAIIFKYLHLCTNCTKYHPPPSGPILQTNFAGFHADQFRCLQRVWRQIAAELIPPPSKAGKAQIKPARGKMTGLDSLEKNSNKLT